MNKISLVVLGVILAVLIIVGAVLLKGADIVGEATKTDKILYNYDWFFSAYASIKSYESQIKVAKRSIEDFKADHTNNLDTYTNSTELARLREVERGLSNQFISLVNEYNNNVKNLTKGTFKDTRLPIVLHIVDGSLVEVY